MKTKTKSGTGRKQRKKKIILTAFAVGAAGILGYFGWQYIKKRKGTSGGNDLDEALKTVSPSNPNIEAQPVYTAPKSNPAASSTVKPKKSSSVFPLKKGSKGEMVRQLQEALVAKHGKAILPKYGADGDFGTETATALKKAGLPATIDESTFNVLVQGAGIDPSSVGKELYMAARNGDFNKALTALKKLKNTGDYSSANEIFKTNPLGLVRQTIVNGLLNTFTGQAQKEQIRLEFLRMGLQFDGNKWSLSGLDGLPIITIAPATIWINAIKGVKVPPRMVLGNEVCKRLDYTLFHNRGKYFLVQSKCVKPLESYCK